MKTTISFVENATTKEAGVFALKYGYAFVKGVCRDIDSFVHKLPWLCIGTVVTISIIASYINISNARIDRDSSLKKQAQLQQQVEQLSSVVEVERNNYGK